MVVASKKVKQYFEKNVEQVNKLYSMATVARKQGLDPSTKVDIKLAKDLAERVVGLISIVAPQVENTEIVPRIQELEKKYGIMDWRVAMQIAYEIAQRRFCKFKDEREAMEIGIKLGFAYVTVGVVSSPLEGLTDIELKDRLDGKGKYFCLNFAGPIRNAGGTGASVGVLIADYVRRKMGYQEYDGTDKEAERCYTELIDYHNRITNLQYVPSKEEILFLIKKLPVEISGMPSEKIEVSNHKDLPRVPTNRIRSGFCLINSSCIPLKAPKLWKQLRKWGKDMGMDQWDFLEEFLKIQHHAKSGGKSRNKSTKDESHECIEEKIPLPKDIEEMLNVKPKLDPTYVYIKDLVAGRPVFSHPLRSGGFRLRYGKSRTSGYSAQSMSPATLGVMDDFITTATQLKVELPGKAAAITVCDTISGPVVLLNGGSVIEVDSEKQASSIKENIKEILYAGDILCNYGDFLDRAQALVYPGYCEEWWAQELEREIDLYFSDDISLSQKTENISSVLKLDENLIPSYLKDPLHKKPSSQTSLKISRLLQNVPLHPKYTYFYTEILFEEFFKLLGYLAKFKSEKDVHNVIKKIILPYNQEENKDEKRSLELLGVPHFVANNEFIVLEGNVANALMSTLSLDNQDKFNQLYSYCSDIIQKENELLKDKRLDSPLDGGAVLYAINKFSKVKIRNKAGTFIGARMGRPEKAKMRKMQTGPHGLFPMGDDGGRFRSFAEGAQKNFIKAEFELWWDKKAGQESIFPMNYKTGNFCERKWWDNSNKVMLDNPTDNRWIKPCKLMEYDFKSHFHWCLKRLKTKVFPDVIKGVVGTPSVNHSPENPVKAILRAKYDVFVNKDGTIRYDGSEVPITHFKPKEVGTTVKKLREMGYTHDIYNEPLTEDNQILELFSQDVILPACDGSPNEAADDVFFRTTKFIDDELKYLYNLDTFYNLKKPADLAGHHIVVLAPHTSAATLGRIVGFTKTQGLYCHPLMHAAIRRDCFSYDTYLPIKHKGVWKNTQIGDLVEELNPQNVVDAYGTKEIRVKRFKTLGLVEDKIQEVAVNNFTKHSDREFVEIKTKLGRTIKTTIEHKHITTGGIKLANALSPGDVLTLPKSTTVSAKNIEELDLINIFKEKDWLMVKGLKTKVNLRNELKKEGVFGKTLDNYSLRDLIPASLAVNIIKRNKVSKTGLFISAKRDTVKVPAVIPVTKDFLKIIGLYIAEGYSRQKQVGKCFYQVYISAEKADVRLFVETYFKTLGLKKSENKIDRVTYSSRIMYELFTGYLQLGSIARDKRIPPQFLTLPKNKCLSLLSGYFEGEGSVSSNQKRIQFDTVSEGLLEDISFMLNRFNIFVKRRTYTKKPGQLLKDFYIKKNRPIPRFTITKGTIQNLFIDQLSGIEFISKLKKDKFHKLLKIKVSKTQLNFDDTYIYDEIISTKVLPKAVSYCLNVPNNTVVANNILTKQCDGDEGGVFLLLDAFLNFSTKYLSNKLGGTMDAPLVLTSILNPTEVDDMVFNIERSMKYPLGFYEAATQQKMPWDFKFELVSDTLGKPEQYEGYTFTHDTDDFNAGVKCSSYKLLPSMKEKLDAQMGLGKKLRAVDESDVARIVIDKHFTKDTKGNLRKFSQQVFRCTKCGAKYRRPPLSGKCIECNYPKIIFTVSEGSIKKYVGYSLELANEYHLPAYVKQSLELTSEAIDSIFGKDAEKQEGLGKFFSN